jgi:peptidoglycan/xylan/chitin deacetylase (PgdA/CDA1 family)
MPVGDKSRQRNGGLARAQALGRPSHLLPSSLRERVREVVLDALPNVVRRGPADARRVALTFDDGPQPLTPQYLDALEALGVPATFFVMGDLSSAAPGRLREYVRRGHQVAAHGWNHRAFPDLSRAELDQQLRDTQAVIGHQPTARPWLRPPYGALSPRVIGQLLARGFTIAMWSFDSLDHEIADVDALVARCAPAQVAPGEVLLFHEGYAHTLAALPRIVGGLRDAGYECVTMFDLVSR